MTGTVIITGASGSCAMPFVSHIISTYPEYTILATVRNASPSDPNTARLSEIISSKPSKAHIESLDLSSLSNVRTFADNVAKRVASGEVPPIKAIVCNAFTMSLTGQVFTSDGFEQTFQVNHLAHYLLVLRLLGSMASDGRVVMLGSDTHYTDRSHPLFSIRTGIPEDVEQLIKPGPDTPGQEYNHGFHRYGVSKLANVMFMHDLNEKLAHDPKLSGITATAMDPGGMVDSRAHKIQKPLIRIAFGILALLLPILKYFTDTLRPAALSGRELVELAVSDKYKGVRGYFMGLRPEEEDVTCKDDKKRDAVWKACWDWAGLTKEDTVLGQSS
ncbi:short-chain alcohol dehydrogenases/reductase [Fusarium heterosporum]|uniref:Short-chain alcohol dehydrogenases/reductase n=1 Tax=Fusarium heterosporum TaxID=42747 RepID=A0A8H5TVG8_FUSHE|nr:short-chain alcohol dehydrogenases/reductase [Fusarium heterosporum]